MSAPRRFVLIGMQRSGTTVTHARLASHPDVAMYDDELHTAFFATAIVGRNARGESTRRRTQSLLDVFDFVAGRRPGVRAVGVKTALPSPALTARLVGCLATHGADLDVIVLQRQDLVAQLGSLRRAQQLAVWHRRSADAAPAAPTRVRIGDDELAAYVADAVACDRLLDGLATSRRVLRLDYDRDVVGGSDWPRVCEFLGIATPPPPPGELRKVSPPAAEYIDDYDALVARLPSLLAACARAPAPAPRFDAGESRLFLLHRARRALACGHPRAAVGDLLAALHAPPEWGVETREWGTAMLGESLERTGDPALADVVARELAADWPDDPHVRALVARIRVELDRL
jgi:hypothetical protein